MMQLHRIASFVLIIVNFCIMAQDPNIATGFVSYILITQQILISLRYFEWRYVRVSPPRFKRLILGVRDNIAFPIVMIELINFWRYAGHKNLAAQKIKRIIEQDGGVQLPRIPLRLFTGMMIREAKMRHPKEYARLQRIQKTYEDINKS